MTDNYENLRNYLSDLSLKTIARVNPKNCRVAYLKSQKDRRIYS